ncbi:MAG: flagellar motor protein MotD [Paludibacterium sp.]|uniref:flagellar motor protein MotD n=1 Tax=Paludibacterium sp. TaxID=1917523 RepID=UPI0025D4C2A6|nr:flagellar motor protein MotD [Paludibacterium sp.]MBV8049204.1 flagellar motor protein MotD [Paludibacterium sp.]MBV8647255.1 flagellar motor protein MotD [Paludibacterium sp.]
MPRKLPDDHDNHDRWLVSYADFITLLFAFFVVMYAISSLNEGKYRVLSTSLVNAFRSGTNISLSTNPSGSANTLIQVPETKPIAKSVQSEAAVREQAKLGKLAADMRRILEPLVKGGQVKISQNPKGIEIEIKDSALFQTGQAQPSDNSVQVLTQVATLLTRVDNSVSVEGFTDNVPIKTANFPSNWELSAARAGSVVRLFQENGVAPDRLVAVGRAENMPVASNDASDGRARNRRVSITVLTNDVSSASGQSVPVEQMRALKDFAASAPLSAAPPAQ